MHVFHMQLMPSVPGIWDLLCPSMWDLLCPGAWDHLCPVFTDLLGFILKGPFVSVITLLSVDQFVCFVFILPSFVF